MLKMEQPYVHYPRLACNTDLPILYCLRVLFDSSSSRPSYPARASSRDNNSTVVVIFDRAGNSEITPLKLGIPTAAPKRL